MNSETVDRFIQSLKDAGGSVREDGYSGRGMYGSYCVGVSAESPSDAFALLYELGRADEDGEFLYFIESTSYDSLGMGVVLYWTRAKIESPYDREERELES